MIFFNIYYLRQYIKMIKNTKSKKKINIHHNNKWISRKGLLDDHTKL
jgi:hypothetical protein